MSTVGQKSLFCKRTIQPVFKVLKIKAHSSFSPTDSAPAGFPERSTKVN